MAELLSKPDSPVDNQTPDSLRDFFEQHLKVWKKSGLSQAEYCRQNGLSRSRFGYWKRKLSNEEKAVEFVMLPANLPEGRVPYPRHDQFSPIRLMVGPRVSFEVSDHFHLSL